MSTRVIRRRLSRVGAACFASAVLATAAVGVVTSPSADADSAASVQAITTGSALSQPCNVQAAPDGSQWFIEAGTRRLGRLNLQTGAITKYPLPPTTVTPTLPVGVQLPGVFPIGPCDMAIPGDGNLYFNDQNNNAIGYISLSSPGAITEIKLPTPASIPMSLSVGADGNLYTTQLGSNQIGVIDVHTHQVTEYNVPTPVSGIVGSVAGQDGAQWFVEIAANKILRMDYATKQMREWTVPTPASLPFVVRSYGGQIYFTMSGAGAIGHFDPTTERFTSIPLPTPLALPVGIIKGVDGMLYTDEAVGNKVAQIDPRTETVTQEIALPAAVPPFADEIKVGPDGALWVPQYFAGQLIRVWLPSFGTDPGVPQNGGQVTGATTLAQDTLRTIGLGN